MTIARVLSTRQLECVRPGLHESETMVIDGLTREFSYYVPSIGTSAPLPVVFYFHGHGDSMTHMLGQGAVEAPSSEWLEVAEEEGYLMFYPLGLEGDDNKTGWNDGRTDVTGNPTADDVGFFLHMVAFGRRCLNLDVDRIYITGHSNGGHLCMRIAMEHAEVVAAVAITSALHPVATSAGTPSMSVPIMFIHGVDDPIAPYIGGEMDSNRGFIYSFDETMDIWRAWNGVDDVTAVSDSLPNINGSDASSITFDTWAPDDVGDGAVVGYSVVGGGHTEPSIDHHVPEIIVGDQCWDAETARIINGFFQTYARQ